MKKCLKYMKVMEFNTTIHNFCMHATSKKGLISLQSNKMI